MSDVYTGPTLLEIDQQEHATLITGEADHGRITFAIEIQNSGGLIEEQDIARRFRKVAEEVGSR